MIVSQIAAISENRILGRENDLPWHIPEDLEFFKTKTVGSVMVLGRKTFDSFGGRPLPKRDHVIVTRDQQFKVDHPRCFVAHSPQEGLSLAIKRAQELGLDETFIAGGGEIYRQLLPESHRIYLTEIAIHVEGDTVFPHLPEDQWQKVSEVPCSGPPAFAFCTYERRA